MKKFVKFLGAVAALGAVVAGGAALYRKFFAPEEDFSDLDDEFDDEFEDEDLDNEVSADRGYVPLHTVKEPEEAPAKAEAAEAEKTEEAAADTTEE